MKDLKLRIYELVDSFLTEAKDQNGNERSLDRLNQDRHLFVDNIMNLFVDNIMRMIKLIRVEERYIFLEELKLWRPYFYRDKITDKDIEDIKKIISDCPVEQSEKIGEEE